MNSPIGVVWSTNVAFLIGSTDGGGVALTFTVSHSRSSFTQPGVVWAVGENGVDHWSLLAEDSEWGERKLSKGD